MEHTAVEHWRKTVTGVCMIAAPVAFLVSDAMWPVTHMKARDAFADVVGNTGRAYTSGLIALLGTFLMAGAVLGLAHMLHERRPGMAYLGGGLSIVGFMAVAGAISVMTLFLSEAAKAGTNHKAMADVFNGMFSRGAPILAATLLTAVGVVVLAVGLYQTKVAASWSAICLGVGAIAINIGNVTSFKPLILASEVVLIAGLGAIGYGVLTETDEEWEHTPEFHGFAKPVTA